MLRPLYRTRKRRDCINIGRKTLKEVAETFAWIMAEKGEWRVAVAADHNYPFVGQ
jgi:hypothetical protein